MGVRTLKKERVIKEDGRYLYYYSWSEEEPAAERGTAAVGEPRPGLDESGEVKGRQG